MAGWKNPETAYIHALHDARWGSGHAVLMRDKQGELYERLLTIDTTTRGSNAFINEEIRFAENVFEELDAENEWFYNPQTQTLYYQPEAGEDLSNALVEAVCNPHLIQLTGTADQ
jgi:hypothetical protein